MLCKINKNIVLVLDIPNLTFLVNHITLKKILHSLKGAFDRLPSIRKNLQMNSLLNLSFSYLHNTESGKQDCMAI